MTIMMATDEPMGYPMTSMPRIWAKREKQLQRMETGMLNVVGDLRGNGQKPVPRLRSIEALTTENA
jgi:hypothetical protein